MTGEQVYLATIASKEFDLLVSLYPYSAISVIYAYI